MKKRDKEDNQEGELTMRRPCLRMVTFAKRELHL